MFLGINVSYLTPLKWIQSKRQAELFNVLFSKYNPSYLHHLPPMVLLSTVAATSLSFDTYLGERLAYLEMALTNLSENVGSNNLIRK